MTVVRRHARVKAPDTAPSTTPPRAGKRIRPLCPVAASVNNRSTTSWQRSSVRSRYASSIWNSYFFNLTRLCRSSNTNLPQSRASCSLRPQQWSGGCL